MKRWLIALSAMLWVFLSPASAQTWLVRQRGTVLEIAYGGGSQFPQYAALHLDSSYFRMVYSPQSGWGTSVVLMPAFWSGGRYYQGAPVTASWRTEGNDLLLSLSGKIASLQVSLEVRLSPPAKNSLLARVRTLSVTGNVALDNRPGEAFKPVMLSSMHISATQWDTRLTYVEGRLYNLPSSGWVIYPARSASRFGLIGGTSSWKTNAPTVEVVLRQPKPLQVTGWVTYSTNPNDDNVGFWAASSQVLREWQYILRATVTHPVGR
ncbi:MAG: hypothetical protein KatS3mg023_0504 [Armatimonadota bacterium]|nr:MAG: hypothetical protein KatS3mg023_0504 [Armatimonadota bacterium]